MELNVEGYRRRDVPFEYIEEPFELANSAEVHFGIAEVDWPLVLGAGIFDYNTANLLVANDLTAPLRVYKGSSVSFMKHAITISLNRWPKMIAPQ
jgi:hypothetical protein